MGLTDTLKGLAAILRKEGSIEATNMVIELQGDIIELRDELQRIKDENQQLREQLELKAKLWYDGGAYWFDDEQGRQGPCCTKCWEDERKAIRMVALEDPYFKCPKCEAGPAQIRSAPSR